MTKQDKTATEPILAYRDRKLIDRIYEDRAAMKPPLPDLIDALTPVVRPAMLEAFNPDCCIATCRILRGVFAGFGYEAEALPCAVSVCNATMSEYLASGAHIPENEEERLSLFARAWRITIQPQNPLDKKRGFGGHVVLRVVAG